MNGVLSGIKVIEVAIYAFVPAAGAVLSDMGADVLKIEHPENPDPMRNLSSYGINKPGTGGPSVLWQVMNRGKRSVGIDIRNPEGLEVLMSLVDEADIFLTNFMQPARAKLGIDAKDILARNPRIIYGRGTGHGPVLMHYPIGQDQALLLLACRMRTATRRLCPGQPLAIFKAG